jgi:hypothetical protein
MLQRIERAAWGEAGFGVDSGVTGPGAAAGRAGGGFRDAGGSNEPPPAQTGTARVVRLKARTTGGTPSSMVR